METILCDSREKARAIVKILAEFDRHGIKHVSTKLLVGDYQNLDNPRLVIDRKQNLSELCLNVCQQHKRFVAELERAAQYGIKLIILCEHGDGIKTLNDVAHWVNPRLQVSPLAVSGERLYKILTALKAKYGTEFLFCSKQQTGREIIRLLNNEP